MSISFRPRSIKIIGSGFNFWLIIGEKMVTFAGTKQYIALDCKIQDLGLIDYRRAYDIQKQCVDDVIRGLPQRLLFCEHPAVITMGRLADPRNLLASNKELVDEHIQMITVDRGGDITLHAPGQLVVYPILNLAYYGKDLHVYLHQLEQVVIDLLRDFGIVANRLNGKTGVWVEDRKLASIGVGVRKWISFHGVGINVNTDLNLFRIIKPCGLDVQMTSIAHVKGQPQEMKLVKQKLMDRFSENFRLSIVRE